MEFLLVHYDRRRVVFVDGRRAGFTNDTLLVGGGRHTVDLGPDKNYRPKQHVVVLRDTTAAAPREVEFRRV